MGKTVNGKIFTDTFSMIFWLAIILMAIALFVRNEKMVIVAAAVNILWWGNFVISGIRCSGKKYFSVYNIYITMSIFAYLALIVILLLALNGNVVVRKIWFIAAVLIFIGYLIDWIYWGYFSQISTCWISMLHNIEEIAGLFFIGLWVKNDVLTSAIETKTVSKQAISSNVAPAEIFGGADKLKMYKELLDSGAITKEEFEEKKKQIIEK
jgi:hypothetical protein